MPDLSYVLKKKYVCIPRSFLVINDCNQGKTLYSPCIYRNTGRRSKKTKILLA